METDIIQSLEKIEAEILAIKEKLKAKSKPVKLEGIWKGLEISDEDIVEAKRAIFKDAYNFDNV